MRGSIRHSSCGKGEYPIKPGGCVDQFIAVVEKGGAPYKRFILLLNVDKRIVAWGPMDWSTGAMLIT